MTTPMDNQISTHTITSFSETMARLRRLTPEKAGKAQIEFWSAREIHPELGYEKWDNFVEVIEKAKENCVQIKSNPTHHFAEVGKMIPIGKGAFREQVDYVLSRTACYLIALNGNPGKEQIAWAKAYFIVQTRAQETSRPTLTPVDERFQLREKLKEAHTKLFGAAKEAGVENFGHFNASGIQGLYKMTMSELKSKKGISQKDDYWDRVCGLELSANEFKAQLAKKTIEQKKIRGQNQAEEEHKRVGRTVRETIHKQAGIFLEQLPPEPSLKALLSAQKRECKLLEKNKSTSELSPSE